MVHVIYIPYKPCWRDSACACVHKHTIADAHFQLRNGLFYTGIGKSLIADWLTSVLMWIDTALWEQVRGKASFFFPLSLFCAVAFCQGEMPGCLPDRSVSPSQMLMWLQGLWMGNETRALSEDPVLHLLSPLFSRYAKSRLAAVCVKGNLSVSAPPPQLFWFTQPPVAFDFLFQFRNFTSMSCSSLHCSSCSC